MAVLIQVQIGLSIVDSRFSRISLAIEIQVVIRACADGRGGDAEVDVGNALPQAYGNVIETPSRCGLVPIVGEGDANSIIAGLQIIKRVSIAQILRRRLSRVELPV